VCALAQAQIQSTKKTEVKQKKLHVAQRGSLSCASGLGPLDLMTKPSTQIQRAWINNDPTRQIQTCHPTVEK
jgi:hypothetical protein